MYIFTKLIIEVPKEENLYECDGCAKTIIVSVGKIFCKNYDNPAVFTHIIISNIVDCLLI